VTSRLATLLEERALTRSDLSRLSEVPYQAIRRLLRDGADPPLDHALRICGALGVDVEELYALTPRTTRRNGGTA
jgi:transcriptional regulator with XRE-family HTH domain